MKKLLERIREVLCGGLGNLAGAMLCMLVLAVIMAGCAGMICKAPAAANVDALAAGSRPATAATLATNATEFQKLYARSTTNGFLWLFSPGYDSWVTDPIRQDLCNFAVDARGFADEAASQPARTPARCGYEDAMFKAVKRFKDGN